MIVDLGCGGGEVTFEMATLVGPAGSVTGVDMDEVTADPRTLIAGPRVFQLWKRR